AAQDPAALDTLQVERVSAYREAGDELLQSQAWEDAAATYQAGYALAQQIDDRPTQAGLLYQLGQIQSGHEDWESALGYYAAAQVLADETGEQQLRKTISQAQLQANHTLGD